MVQQPKPFSLFSTRHLPLTVPIGLALAIFGATVFFASLHLRRNSRDQILGQHAQILYALWLSQKLSEDSEGLAAPNEDVADQLPTVLQTARLRQLVLLLGTRIFDASGHFEFADANVTESRLPPGILERVRTLKPVAQLREAADLGEISVVLSPGHPPRGPLLDIYVPLHSSRNHRLAGVAQFILDGSTVAEELRQFDRHLAFQAVTTFVVGGGLLVLILGLSFRQLQRMNQLLTQRTASLLRANDELTLAAKTSAVGAVTAHLIHGLRNPLSGLQSFVSSQQRGLVQEKGSDWELALSSTHRMQGLIGEIVRVLRDENSSVQYELSLQELVAMIEAKVCPLAQEAGIHFQVELQAQGTLVNRQANLVSLILYNLVQNAIQATPKGKSVTLAIRPLDPRIACEVRDEGPGIPPEQQATLFKPCRSEKEGGSGLGLAISNQLAKCLGADLHLQESTGQGSVFVLVFTPEREFFQDDLAAVTETS